ncbi:hypothetical protein SESBI_07340 [Sesbania bispinosa]|nr:hypothetical protein SESBI_07340 [Sesbania bispinosa]
MIQHPWTVAEEEEKNKNDFSTLTVTSSNRSYRENGRLVQNGRSEMALKITVLRREEDAKVKPHSSPTF